MKQDSQLIQMVLDGDSHAFGQIVVKYQDRLFTSMVHVVGNTEEAEDVVQDAFVRAYLKLASFDGRSSLFTWLYRIAFYRAKTRQRANRPEVSSLQAWESRAMEPSDDGEAPEDRLIRNERAGQIQQALSRLSDEYRMVIILREMEELDYEAIAEILEISVGTVRSRLHRARSLMRQQLRDVREGTG